jgi:DNA (cytosine-5)-methyltransferase 1
MEQLDIFDLGVEYHYRPPLLFNSPVRLFEAFAGIGCQAMSFKRAKIPYEIIGISEIDKHSLVSHKAIHSKHNNYGDISLMGEIPPCDVFTWSFPCQSLSKAGKRAGFKDMRKSGLVFQVLRLLRDTYGYIPHRHQPKNSTFHSMGEATNHYTPGDKNKLPKVLIMENVPDLVQNSFKAQFYEIQKEIASYGYKNFTLCLNAKDFGVAQNRDRVFMVSLLGDYHYEFPMPFRLEKRLKDYLEPNVPEKYYLSEKAIEGIKNSNFNSKITQIQDENSVVATLLSRDYKDPKCIQVGVLEVRKLCPIEVWRLMGISDDDFYKAQKVCSNSQLYKQAGNGIVVDVFAAILKNLIEYQPKGKE